MVSFYSTIRINAFNAHLLGFINFFFLQPSKGLILLYPLHFQWFWIWVFVKIQFLCFFYFQDSIFRVFEVKYYVGFGYFHMTCVQDSILKGFLIWVFCKCEIVVRICSWSVELDLVGWFLCFICTLWLWCLTRSGIRDFVFWLLDNDSALF